MNIKELFEVLKNGTGGSDLSEKIEKEVVKPIVSENDITDEEIASRIVKLLKENPQQRQEIIEELQQRESISYDMLAQAAVKITNAPDISNETAIQMANKLPDDKAIKVLEDADIKQSEQFTIIGNLEDKKIKQQQVLEQLKLYYKICDEIPVAEVESKLKDLEKIVEPNDEIKEWLYRIIAKNMASAYIKMNGAVMVGPFARVLPASEMFEAGIPNKVGQEYAKLADKKSINVKEYDKTSVKKLLLDIMAKEIAQTESDIGQFLIPQSKEMQSLTDDEEKDFINEIEIYVKNMSENGKRKLNFIEIDSIKNQIHGFEQGNNNKRELMQQLSSQPANMQNQFSYLFLQILKDPEYQKVFLSMAESGLMKEMREMSPEELKSSFEVMSLVVKQKMERKREKNVADKGDLKQTPNGMEPFEDN